MSNWKDLIEAASLVNALMTIRSDMYNGEFFSKCLKNINEALKKYEETK